MFNSSIDLYSIVKIENAFAFQYSKQSAGEVSKPTSEQYQNFGYIRYHPIQEFKRLNIPNENWRLTMVFQIFSQLYYP